MRLIFSLFALPALLCAADYRVDCADARWRSVDALNQLDLKPGDRLLLRAGCRWSGTLQPKGSGTEGRPIVLDRFGEGPLPAIDGAGGVAALLLRNQEFWEIANLELTNDAAAPGLRRGLLATAGNTGAALRHIHVSGLDIHDVKGQLGADMVSKCTGGIGFEAVTKGKPARFDDVLIENNHIHTVDNMGIYLNSDSGPHPRDPNWEALRHTRIVVRNNRLEDIGKNAICLRASLDALIERNVVRKAAARYHGNAIYVFGCRNAIIQFNEVSHTNYLDLEGAAFDADYNSEGTVIQYNYSHDNGGGLADICNNPDSKPPRGYNDGAIIRYNVSRNEGYRVIAFDGPATNTRIYNNTLVIPAGTKPHIIEFDLFGKSPGYPDRTSIRNNIIVNLGEGSYLWGKATNYSFEGNCFGGKAPPKDLADPLKIVADPQFIEPERAGDGIDSVTGYRLKPGSPCAGSGVAIEAGGGRDFIGGAIPAVPDRGAIQTPAYQVIEGMVWARPQGIDLKADLYLPNGSGPFPAIVFLHGGGFTDRNRAQLRCQAAHMAALGMAGFAIEYRVSGEAPYPAAVYDAKAAVRWLRANATRYHLDSGHIFAVGSSAGGYLAAMLGVTPDDPALEGDGCCQEFSSRVTAVAAFNPVLDLTALGQKDSTARFLGGKCEERLELCRQASPITHAGRSAAPILILHGTADQTVPYRQATAMVDKLKAAGAVAELFTAPDGAHTFWSTPKWYEPSEKAMTDFLFRFVRVEGRR